MNEHISGDEPGLGPAGNTGPRVAVPTLKLSA